MRKKISNVAVLVSARDVDEEVGGIVVTPAGVFRLPTPAPRLRGAMARFEAYRPASSNPEDILVAAPVRDLLKETLELIDEINQGRDAVLVVRDPVTGVVVLWVGPDGKVHGGHYPLPGPDWPIAPFLAATEVYHLAAKIGNHQAARQIEATVALVLEKQAVEITNKVSQTEAVPVG
jgi:hypothetical protein